MSAGRHRQTAQGRQRPSVSTWVAAHQVWAAAIAGIVILAVIGVVALGSRDRNNNPQLAAPTPLTASSSVTPPPSPSPSSSTVAHSAPPATTAPVTAQSKPPPVRHQPPLVALKSDLVAKLAPSNLQPAHPRVAALEYSKHSGVLVVPFLVQNQPTQSQRNLGAKRDVHTMLSVKSHQPGGFRSVTFQGFFPFTNNLGERNLDEVVNVTYLKSKLDKLDLSMLNVHLVYGPASVNHNQPGWR